MDNQPQVSLKKHGPEVYYRSFLHRQKIVYFGYLQQANLHFLIRKIEIIELFLDSNVMGRSYVIPVQQPDDFTCGPTAMKHALEIFGKKKSIKSLSELCKTNFNGTSTKNIIQAFRKLGYPVLAVEKANLRHIQSALKHKPNQERAALVTYLYDLNENEKPHPESGHWAVVASYSSRNGRIILMDSATAAKKSYSWQDFRKRWKDYDLARKTRSNGSIEVVKKWQHQLLIVVAKEPEHLPKFSIKTKKKYLPVN